jgi:O-antigen/teichoic acid export membrane protein
MERHRRDRNVKLKDLFHSAARVATGEVFGRLATFVLYAYVSRRYGVEVLGIVALGQVVATYVIEGSDQGLKLIAVRLLARKPDLADYLVPAISRRRTGFTSLAVLLGVAYGLLGPVPAAARTCVVAFVLAVIPYSCALDWVAWGLGKFGVLASWRSGVSILYVLIAVLGMRMTGRPIASMATGNFTAAALGAFFLWLVWRVRWRQPTNVATPDALQVARQELRVSRVMTLGSSNLLNLIFLNADILILGAMSTTHEVGRYSAACKPLYVLFTGFWLLTDVLYPHIAAAKDSTRARSSLLRWLALLAMASAVVAGLLGFLAPRILTVIYGSTMGAAGLFRVLLVAMPLDFCFSLLWTVLVSRGYDRFVLYALATAALSDVALNWIFIPRFQAGASAWATVASYTVLFGMMLVFVLRHDVLSRRGEDEPVPSPSEYAL